MAKRYFTLMQSIIDHHQGCSDKFPGDAVLAFWNGLSDEPEHAIKALAAAQDIINAVTSAQMSDQSRLAGRAVVCLRGDVDRTLELGIRIGVATLRIIGHAEFTDHLGGVRIVRAKGLRDDGKRPFGIGFQVAGAALSFVDRRKVVEDGSDFGVIGTERRFRMPKARL